jgi:hypothetical protein
MKSTTLGGATERQKIVGYNEEITKYRNPFPLMSKGERNETRGRLADRGDLHILV